MTEAPTDNPFPGDSAVVASEAVLTPTETPVADREDRTVTDASVREIDQALADDLDSLLQGDFASVDEVLAGVFDEKPPAPELPAEAPPDPVDDVEAAAVTEPLVEPPAEPPTEPADAATPPPAADDTPVATAAADKPVSVPAVTANESDSTEPPSDPPPATPAPVTRPPVAGGPADSAKEPPPAADADRPATKAEAGDEPTPEPEAAPEPAAPTPPPIVLGVLRDVLMTTLVVINMPLRFVPPTLRPLVDWVALTLVFWVPIVWAIAALTG